MNSEVKIVKIITHIATTVNILGDCPSNLCPSNISSFNFLDNNYDGFNYNYTRSNIYGGPQELLQRGTRQTR
jgi:hypothetical protein